MKIRIEQSTDVEKVFAAVNFLRSKTNRTRNDEPIFGIELLTFHSHNGPEDKDPMNLFGWIAIEADESIPAADEHRVAKNAHILIDLLKD